MPASPAAAAGDPFVNGGFEQPVVEHPYRMLDASDPDDASAMPGWTITSGTVDIVRAGADFLFGPYVRSGEQGLDLAGCSGGTIEQTFDSVPGSRLAIRYWANGVPGRLWRTTVVSGSSTVEEHGVLGTRPADGAGWEQWGPSDFVAGGTTTTVTIAAPAWDGWCDGVHLDDFEVIVIDADGDGLNEDVDTNTRADCKSGGWQRFTSPTFRNQGQCVAHHERAEAAGRS